jgi:hypothetical protein
MRALAVISLLAVAACGDDGAARNDLPPAPERVAAGQWALQSQVTTFQKADNHPPAINTPVGTRAAEAVCVGATERPPTTLFSGPGYRCHDDSFYSHNGHFSVTLTCTRPGLAGNIMMSADGTFDDRGMDFERNVRTILSGNGDVVLAVHVTGRRGGACTPAPEGRDAGGGSPGEH